MNDWIRGIKKGLPIAIGYLSVSFTFGVKAVNAGIPVWITILISVANVTSAGQFAGVAIMAAHGSYLEMAMTTFIINVRYMLMSFSLSQKVDKKMTLRQRLMIGYGITDEIFAVSSMETESLSARFMYGLITVPVFGWTVGTAAGALASQIMPGLYQLRWNLVCMRCLLQLSYRRQKRARPFYLLLVLLLSASVFLLRHRYSKKFPLAFR